MNRHILYIINPISGTRKKAGLQKLIEEQTTKAGIPFQIIPSVANGNYDFLKTIISQKKITDVVIVGGDGTVSQVVGSLKNTGVNFGILPFGSGNGLALAAGIPTNSKKALQLIFSGKPKLTDGFYVNEYFSCMLSGLGFDAQVAHDFARQKRRGFFTYVVKTIRNFLKGKTYSFKLQLAEIELETHAYFISIANSNQFGNHLTIAPLASLSDGLLDIIVLPEQNRFSFAYNMLKQIAGFNKLQENIPTLKNKNILYFQTDQLTIININKAPLHIDGDPAALTESIHIKVEKHAFRLIGKYS